MENAIYDPRTTRVVQGQASATLPEQRDSARALDPVALEIQGFFPEQPGRASSTTGISRTPPTRLSRSRHSKSITRSPLKGSRPGTIPRYLGTALQRVGRPAHPITGGAPVRDLDAHDARELRLDGVADDPVEQLASDTSGTTIPISDCRKCSSSIRSAKLGFVGAVNGNGFPVINSMFTQQAEVCQLGMAVAGTLPATKKPQSLIDASRIRATTHLQGGVRVAR